MIYGCLCNNLRLRPSTLSVDPAEPQSCEAFLELCLTWSWCVYLTLCRRSNLSILHFVGRGVLESQVGLKLKRFFLEMRASFIASLFSTQIAVTIDPVILVSNAYRNFTHFGPNIARRWRKNKMPSWRFRKRQALLLGPSFSRPLYAILLPLFHPSFGSLLVVCE